MNILGREFRQTSVAIGLLLIGMIATESHAGDEVGVFGGGSRHRNSLAAELTNLGHTVTVSSPLAGLGSLSQYDTVWHLIGVGAPPFTPPTRSSPHKKVTSKRLRPRSQPIRPLETGE